MRFEEKRGQTEKAVRVEDTDGTEKGQLDADENGETTSKHGNGEPKIRAQWLPSGWGVRLSDQIKLVDPTQLPADNANQSEGF